MLAPIARTLALLARLPHRHLVMAASTLVATVLALFLIPGEEAEARRTAIPLSLELKPPSVARDLAEEPLGLELPWQHIEVRPGDNLSLIFQRAGLGPRDVHEVITGANQAQALAKLKPGQLLSFRIDEQGRLQALNLKLDMLNSLLYERSAEGFHTSNVSKQAEVRYRVASATISSSLFLAATDAGLPQGLIMELANIFGGVIDFVYDVREGDHFIVLYEELYLDGEHLGSGDILAAEYANQGKPYQAFRYANTRGEVNYFSADGVSMRKAFLRAPLDFTRISSGFDPKRLHPVFKTVRPHRGIDYAAPRGTPVYAAGDGRVTAAGYSKANGNYVFIKHGEEYVTKYLHLHKRAVRTGQRVKQKQTIGWVGSTGYATGPHLHYEFVVNGVHRNPRTVLAKLPKAKRITPTEMPRFKEKIAGLELQLATYAGQRGYRDSAQLDTDNSDG